MKVLPKTLHVVAYAKVRGQEPEVVGHGKLKRDGSLLMRAGRAQLWSQPLTSQRLANGKIMVRRQDESVGREVRIGTLTPGKKLAVRSGDGVRLHIEAREVTPDAGPKMTARAISPAALRAFEAKLRTREEHQASMVEVRAALEGLRQSVAEQRRGFGASRAEIRKLESESLRQAAQEALDQRVAHLDAKLAEAEQRAARLAGQKTLGAERVARFAAYANALVESLPKFLLDGSVLGTLHSFAAVVDKLAAVNGKRHPKLAERLAIVQAQADELRDRILRSISTLEPLAEIDLGPLECEVAILDVPGWDVRGRAIVTAERRGNVLTHWTVRFENSGGTPFIGTIVMKRGDKNGGIGFESMGLPGKGDAAEQIIQLDGLYGSRAQVGSMVRLGVRSHASFELALPKSGSVEIDLLDFEPNPRAVEDLDWVAVDYDKTDFERAHVIDKRVEKYATGKVRFFAGYRPWAPPGRLDKDKWGWR